MKDWKGVEVKAGDTVVIVRVRDMEPLGVITSVLLIDKDGDTADLLVQEPAEAPSPRPFIWEVTERRNVFELTHQFTFDNGTKSVSRTVLFYEQQFGNCRMIIPLDDPFGNRVFKEHIICIEGKSDNEQEYYQHVFST